MKSKAILPFFLLVILVLILGFQITDDRKDDFETLKKSFMSPDKEYGSAPLWVWHTKVTKTIIDSMMHEFKENAFGGVMVHPRPGLINEYLSQEWYDLFKYTVQKGKELGLNVWIYDENSYPTGFAGGHVPDQMPESYNQGQMLRMSKTTSYPESSDNVFIILKEEDGKFINVTASPQEKDKTGNYYVFTKVYYAKQAGMVGPPDFPYVDLMVKGVTQKFIDVTFKGYEKVAGKEFGKTVPGIFSDEPSIPAHGAGNIRWTPDLFSEFRKTWGYDLESNLASLFEETGDWKKVRHNYMTVLSQLFIDRWSKPMYEYTEKHNLKWTGHYWEHGWPNPNDVPDNMAMYAWHQYPGIDMLFNQFNEVSPNAQFGNIRSVKELSSVANQLNKERTLSETYGGGGWELTFKDMKRLNDWQYVLGVNLLNQHLSMMTLTGARKYDYPQSFSYHTPWWPYYKTLNEYNKRLSLALSHGKQENHILVIEPTTSAWMYVSRTDKNPRFSEIGNTFQAFVTSLEKAQVEYDLGSENIIKDHGKIAGGKFVVGQRPYSVVVVPPGMENIDGPTFKLLKEYVQQGGKVVQFKDLKTLDGAANAEVENFENNSSNLRILELNQDVINTHFQSVDFTVNGNGTDSIGGNLYHHRRKLSDGQLVFFSNASMNSSAAGKAVIKGKDALIMDLFTGEIMDYPDQEQNGKVSIHFDIPAAGSILVFVSDKKQSGYKKYPVPGNKIVVKTTPAKVIRPHENTLMIDFCDLKLKDTLITDAHVSLASRTAFIKNGFNKNPWNHQMQFKDRIVSRDTFSRGSGFTATYHFVIDNNVDYKNFRVVIEQGNLWKSIAINGKSVKPEKNSWWLDRSFSVLEAGKYLQAGENTLSVSIDPMSVYAEIEPAYILGNFNLEPAAKGWKIVAAKPLTLGSWNKQGLSMYGQSISYVKEVRIDNLNDQYEVQLASWSGTVAAVKVNGKDAGIIMSDPNALNITKYLKKGTNQIEVEVVGSLKNLLGPHHNSPKPGMVGPGHWNVKSYPSGSKYETYDYGLMEDFRVLHYSLRN
ncbi:MAG TPA: glycosyl hydrolase [Sphingobacteriaceae bacterium]